MEENNFLRAYIEYLELYLRYLDRNPRIEEIYISDGRRLNVEDSDTGIYQFGISESEFLRLDKMMSGELKVLINEQEYENEILSFDKVSIVIQLQGIRGERIERVCLAGDAKFLKRIAEKQRGILESLHENQSNLNILFGNFEGAERVSCSFEDGRVERNPKQKEAVEFSVGVKDLFLIWGPPGTGKSTVVPEIIRNYLSRESDAKILVCSYTNKAVDRIVEIICNDENLRQKIVRVGPSQIKEEYNDVKLAEIVKHASNAVKSEIGKLEKDKKRLEKRERGHHDEEKKIKDVIRRSDSEEERVKFEKILESLERVIADKVREIKEIEGKIESLRRSVSERKDLEKKRLDRKEIIATTNLKVLTSIFDDLHFDLAIMDEAGFTDLPAALGPFVKADKLILIGDHKQLRPITPNEREIEEHIDRHKFIEKSIFELRWKRKQTENQGTMLNVQHRMRKEIAGFISEEFYNGGLETDERIEERGNLHDAEDPVISPNYPLVFINIRAFEKRDARKSPFCHGEIEVINRIVKGFAKHNGNEIYNEIGVITHFRAQSNRIKDKLPKGVACGTVHAFQGHEKPIVIHSTVRQKVDTRSPLFRERWLNVAVSRAMYKFILVGNKKILNQIPHYRDFIVYAERYGRVYEEIPIKYDYTNRCVYCGKEIIKTHWACTDCFEVWMYEEDKKRRNEFIRTQDGHHVRSKGEKEIDDWLYEHHIRHESERHVEKNLFSMDKKFEKDLSRGIIPKRWKNMFEKKGIPLSGDIVIRKENDNKWKITDEEKKKTYFVKKEREKLNIYEKARRPMRCDWYLPDYDIYVEYWGMMEDAHYQMARRIKIKEYNRLQLKLLSIEREDFDNLDETLREKFRKFRVALD